MDTSEEYIKMCEAAEEIQGAWEVEEGDYFAEWIPERTKHKLPIIFCGIVDGETVPERDKFKSVWLPRQDQLQEIMQEDAISLIQKLMGWIVTNNYIPIGLPQPTMEQLWLSFVMYEKYEKKWDGETWATVTNKLYKQSEVGQ